MSGTLSIGIDPSESVRGAAQVTRSLEGIQRAATAMEGTTHAVTGSFSRLSQATFQLNRALALLGVAFGFSQLVAANTEYERLTNTLHTVTGSARNASIAFDALSRFADTTPFAVSEVVESFIQMKQRGLDPSIEAIRDFGNVASSVGRPLLEIIRGISSAASGQSETLESLGLQITTTPTKYMILYRGVTTEVERSLKGIEGFMRRMGQNEFGGATERAAETIGGLTSTLLDSVSGLMRSIGRGGFNDAWRDLIKFVTDGFTSLNGVATAFGQTFGAAMQLGLTAAKALRDEIKGLGPEAKDLATSIAIGTAAFFGFNAAVLLVSGSLAILRYSSTLMAASFGNVFGIAGIASILLFSAAIAGIVYLVQAFKEKATGLSTVFAGLAAYVVTFAALRTSALLYAAAIASIGVAANFASIGLAVMTAFAGPIGIAALAIGTLVAAFLYFKDSVIEIGGTPMTVVEALGGAFSLVGSAIKVAWDNVKSFLSTVAEFFSQLFSFLDRLKAATTPAVTPSPSRRWLLRPNDDDPNTDLTVAPRAASPNLISRRGNSIVPSTGNFTSGQDLIDAQVEAARQVRSLASVLAERVAQNRQLAREAEENRTRELAATTQQVSDAANRAAAGPDSSTVFRRLEGDSVQPQAAQVLTQLQQEKELVGQVGVARDALQKIQSTGINQLNTQIDAERRAIQSIRDLSLAIRNIEFDRAQQLVELDNRANRALQGIVNPTERARVQEEFTRERYRQQNAPTLPTGESADRQLGAGANPAGVRTNIITSEQMNVMLRLASSAAGIDEELPRRMLNLENNLSRRNAEGSWPVSSAGARGPAQVMPDTFRELAQRYPILNDLGGINNDLANIAAGAFYLRQQVEAAKAQEPNASPARIAEIAGGRYNAGPNRDPNQYGEETRRYQDEIARGRINRVTGQRVEGPYTGPGLTGPTNANVLVNPTSPEAQDLIAQQRRAAQAFSDTADQQTRDNLLRSNESNANREAANERERTQAGIDDRNDQERQRTRDQTQDAGRVASAALIGAREERRAEAQNQANEAFRRGVGPLNELTAAYLQLSDAQKRGEVNRNTRQTNERLADMRSEIEIGGQLNVRINETTRAYEADDRQLLIHRETMRLVRAELAPNAEAARLMATETVNMEDKVKRANQAFERQRTLLGNQDWANGLSQAYRKVTDDLNNLSKNIGDTFTGITKTMEDSLTEFITTGKFKFSDFVTSIVRDLARLASRTLIGGILGGGKPDGGGGGGILGLLGLGGSGNNAGSTAEGLAKQVAEGTGNNSGGGALGWIRGLFGGGSASPPPGSSSTATQGLGRIAAQAAGATSATVCCGADGNTSSGGGGMGSSLSRALGGSTEEGQAKLSDNGWVAGGSTQAGQEKLAALNTTSTSNDWYDRNDDIQLTHYGDEGFFSQATNDVGDSSGLDDASPFETGGDFWSGMTGLFRGLFSGFSSLFGGGKSASQQYMGGNMSDAYSFMSYSGGQEYMGIAQGLTSLASGNYAGAMKLFGGVGQGATSNPGPSGSTYQHESYFDQTQESYFDQDYATGGIFARPYATGGTLPHIAQMMESSQSLPKARSTAGDVISKPTRFAMLKDQLGVLGEKGPEAIVPLSEGKGGLGVKAVDAMGQPAFLSLLRGRDGKITVNLQEFTAVERMKTKETNNNRPAQAYPMGASPANDTWEMSQSSTRLYAYGGIVGGAAQELDMPSGHSMPSSPTPSHKYQAIPQNLPPAMPPIVNVKIETKDAPSFRNSQPQVASAIGAAVGRAARRNGG